MKKIKNFKQFQELTNKLPDDIFNQLVENTMISNCILKGVEVLEKELKEYDKDDINELKFRIDQIKYCIDFDGAINSQSQKIGGFKI